MPLPQDQSTFHQRGDAASRSAAPPGVNALAFARGEELFKNLWEHIGSKWKHFTSQPRARQPQVLQHTALTYLRAHTKADDRTFLRIYLTASNTGTGVVEQLRELLIHLPETAFRGTVDTGQAAPDKDLRETPAGTIEPRMSRLRTLRAAQREVGRRAKKKAKPRAPRINHQRIGKTSMSMWLVPELLDRIDRVADKLGLTRQDFLTLALERIATCYEQDSAKTIEASTAVIEQTRQLERALHQFTTTLATSPK